LSLGYNVYSNNANVSQSWIVAPPLTPHIHSEVSWSYWSGKRISITYKQSLYHYT